MDSMRSLERKSYEIYVVTHLMTQECNQWLDYHLIVKIPLALGQEDNRLSNQREKCLLHYLSIHTERFGLHLNINFWMQFSEEVEIFLLIDLSSSVIKYMVNLCLEIILKF